MQKIITDLSARHPAVVLNTEGARVHNLKPARRTTVHSDNELLPPQISLNTDTCLNPMIGYHRW